QPRRVYQNAAGPYRLARTIAASEPGLGLLGPGPGRNRSAGDGDIPRRYRGPDALSARLEEWRRASGECRAGCADVVDQQDPLAGDCRGRGHRENTGDIAQPVPGRQLRLLAGLSYSDQGGGIQSPSVG